MGWQPSKWHWAHVQQPGFTVASSSDIVFKNNIAFYNGINCVIENDHNLTAPDLKTQCPA
jgi:hypothetical protein